MKKLIFIFLLFGKAFAQCGAGDTVTVNTVTNITTSSATISGTFPSNDSVTAFTLHYVRVGYGDTVNATAGAFSRNITGLLSNTLYRYYWTTECGVGTKRKQSGYYTFRTLGGITYTPMTAAGYEFKYLKADTGFALPLQDTAKKRSVDRAGLMVYKSGDGVYVFDGGRWKFMPDAKFVSSPDGSVNVTESGDNIYLSVNGTVSPLQSNYIISAEPIQQSDDTVDVIPNIIFYQDGVRDTLTTGSQYIVPYASSGQKRIDEIIIDNGALDTLKGVEDSSTVVPRTLTGSQILLAYVNVYGTDSIVVIQPSTYQRTSIVYVGSDGKLKTDSARFSFSESSNKVSIGLGTEQLTIEAVPGDFVGGSTGLFRAENLQLQSTRASGGTLTKDLDNEWIRPSGNEYRMFLNNASKYLSVSHDAANAKYIFKLSSKSSYTGNDLIGFQFGYKNRTVIGDSLTAADSIPSAILALKSDTKGFKPPTHTGTQMNAVSSPVAGLIVYNSDSSALCYYNGSAWVKLAAGSGTSGWGLTGNSGTDSTANFIGTSDGKPLLFRVNNDTVAKFGRLYNFQFGLNTVASGYSSIALGEGNTASGNRSFASGYGNTASGYASTAMGISTTASGENAITIGNSSTATNVNSTAVGSNAASTGEDATAVGMSASASEQNSSAFGYNASAEAIGATAIGYGSTATVENSTVIGGGIVVKTDTTIINNITRFAGNALAGTGKVPTAIDAYGNWTWQTPSLSSLTGLGTGVGTFLGTPSSANLRAALTDESGTGAALFANGNIGDATGNSLTLSDPTKAFSPNKGTTSQMNAISSPTDGMMFYNTDEKAPFYYNSDWGWESNSLVYKTKYGTDYFNDFLAPVAGTGDNNIYITTAGGAIAATVASETNRQGIVNLSTSTSAIARAYISTAAGTTNQTMILGGGKVLFEAAVRVPTLSTSGERFQLLVGLGSINNSVDQGNGVMFLYDEGGVSTGSAASANWQVYTARASSRTFTTTSTAVTANQWYKLKAIVNAAATSVTFYIDDVAVKTETLTIPTGALGITINLVKSVGTTARTADVDYIYFKQKYTTTK